MEYMHRPVLLKQTLEFLNIKPGGTYIDGTVGGGGHSAAILERLTEGGRLLGIDFDNEALEAARNRLSEVGSNANWYWYREFRRNGKHLHGGGDKRG